MRVTILTVSDSVSKGRVEDRSGRSVAERCTELGWDIISTAVLPDDRSALERFLTITADGGACDLILTTGGTGLGPRDVTPEATLAIGERVIPGFSEQMRAEGQKKNPRAILSRAVAVVRGTTIVINLPGSPQGAVESLDVISKLLPHAVDVLQGLHHG